VTGGFAHSALLYADQDEFLRGVIDFLEPALARREPALIALPAERLELVRAHVGDRAELWDMREAGRNPGRLIGAYHERICAQRAGTVHFVGEVLWPGRSAEELVEALLHEALANLAFAKLPARALCPLDRAHLDRAVLERARRAHPLLAGPGGSVPNREYRPQAALRALAAPLPPPPARVARLPFEGGDLARVRALVAGCATSAGLEASRRADLVLVASELAANSLVHGGGRGELRVWSTPERIICEVAGPGEIADPLAGRMRPSAEQRCGRGLWLANQLCELAQVRSYGGGSVVRVQMLRPTRDRP
jgi:anti-sigma regulatory factor (Ser/Thr protein kinase)